MNVHCPACAYNLTGTEGDCPECGAAVDRPALLQQAMKGPEALSNGLFILTLGPLAAALVAILPWDGTLVLAWLIWLVVGFGTCIVTSVRNTQRLSFRRVVLRGQPPSAAYEMVVSLLLFAALAVYGLMSTTVGIVFSIGLASHRWIH